MRADLEVIPPRPRGRPSLYNPAYCDRVIELAAEGCCKAEIAASLGVNARTLSLWSKNHEEFSDAMIRAKELEYAWWLSAGRKGQFMRNWSASGWALQMRNRFRKRFRDRNPFSRESETQGSFNADHIREEIEQKLSRFAAGSEAEGVPVAADATGTRNPEI